MSVTKKLVSLIFVVVLVVTLFVGIAPHIEADQDKNEGSFSVYVFKDGEWQLQGELSFTDYETFQLPLSNDAGQLKIKLVQKGHDSAFVDYIMLQKYDISYLPISAINIDSNADVLTKILNPEYDVCDGWGSTLEVFWNNAPQNATLIMRAMEEDLGEGHGAPLYYPSLCGNRTLGHLLVYDGGITVDGVLDEYTEPDFQVFWQPYSPHPDGYTYGWIHCDYEYLYAAVEVTVDNTADAEDWGALYIMVDGKQKEFRISEDQTWGVRGFGYTSSVPYEHRVYEFKIPLSAINAVAGNEIKYVFGAYGTATGLCYTDADCDQHNYCQVDYCNTCTHTCVHASITNCCKSTAECTDGDACTTDTCDLATNRCVFVPKPDCCKTDADCKDNDLYCTIDTCSTITGMCQHTPVSNCCDHDGQCLDKNWCTNDYCSNHMCVHDDQGRCDDNDPCTDDSCSPASCNCTHTVLQASAASNSPVCIGSTIQLTGGPASMISYSWSGPNGFTSSKQNPTVSSSATQNDAGSYVLTVTNSNSCTDNETTVVSVKDCECTPPVDCTITASTLVNANSTGNVAWVADAGAGAIYVWTINNGAIIGGVGTKTIIYTAGPSGNVTLSVKITNTNGCSCTSSTTITTMVTTRRNVNINQAKPQGRPSGGTPSAVWVQPLVTNLIVNPTVACSNNQCVTVMATVVNNSDSVASTNLQLKINGAVEQTKTVSLAPGSQQVNFRVCKNQPGTYNVSVGTKNASFMYSLDCSGASGTTPARDMLIGFFFVGLLALAAVGVLVVALRRR